MRVAVGTLLLAAATTSFAQHTPPVKTVPLGVVTGHVYCADTNGPARLAKVVLEPADAIDGYTSSENKSVTAHMSGVQTLPDGSFTVQHVAPGAYYVFASEPGYVSPLAKLAATREQLTQPDKDLKAEIAKGIPRVTVQANLPAAIDVTLERGAAVSGTVLYDDGSPAAGLEVQLLVRQKDKWVEPRTGPVQDTLSTTTDDRGTYRISSLPAREYLLAVQLCLSKTNYDVSGQSFSINNDDYTIPIYSGNKLRPKEATPFLLKLGEERPGEDIQVPLAKLHSVAGSIVAARDGHTVNGGHVALLYADDHSEAVNTKLTQGDTGWTLSFVPEGDYVLRVSDGADMEYEDIPNPAGSVPTSHTESHAVHHYAPGEQPLHVEGEVSGLAVSVPELGAKKAQGSQ